MWFRLALVGLLVTVGSTDASPVAPDSFDHEYQAYAALLREHVKGSLVDYGRLKGTRAALDRVVEGFGAVDRQTEARWTRDRRLAFWINAYNVFTLRAVVDHYPIEGSWLSLHPRNSIRQIDGVWTKLAWRAAGRAVTLDQIEHEIIRREFNEPRIHFAVNCASVSCPPLAAEPYRATALERQLDAAARRYLASPLGLVVEGGTVRLSSLFKWYGADFVARFASKGPPSRPELDRALLAFVAAYGPPAAASLAGGGQARMAYLDYDWSLNDVATTNE